MTALTSLLCMLLFSAVFTTEDLGPHNINGLGCTACHQSAVSPEDGAGGYLWGDFSQTSYTTYGGATLTVSADVSGQDPIFLSAVCIVCHDSALADTGYGAVSVLKGHPINVPYRLGGEHWPGTVTAEDVKFTQNNFDVGYGRPLRFYIASGVPYVECGTCHDPHHYSTATVTINGQQVNRPTQHFVRGWYDTTSNSNSVSQFCRACHYEMSNEAFGVTSPTR